MSKLFFFDIDGTLIECSKGIYSIPQKVREAMDSLKRQGHAVFLATGRCKCFIVDGVMDYPFSGYVTCNGAYVEYENKVVDSFLWQVLVAAVRCVRFVPACVRGVAGA